MIVWAVTRQYWQYTSTVLHYAMYDHWSLILNHSPADIAMLASRILKYSFSV